MCKFWNFHFTENFIILLLEGISGLRRPRFFFGFLRKVLYNTLKLGKSAKSIEIVSIGQDKWYLRIYFIQANEISQIRSTVVILINATAILIRFTKS